MDYYVGKILDGRYEIQEVLGVGGMAIVYRAYDNIDDRPVAVKVLKEEYLANEEFRRRFKNESKAIAMLSHPNIVKVYDVSYGERLQYIVMEYVEGITLKEYIEHRRVIPWKEAVHFLTQILRALQHAHDRGVVHRDVKPQNIMLLHSGNIKVTDFGIARFTRSETRTMTKNAIGSVHYISPEQARGDLTDGKSDIYSVGVVLYEMLTGELPFQSDSTVSVAIMQLQSEPRRPRELNDQIPLGLEQITIRAMQKSPDERYLSAAEMLLDLEEFKRNPLIRFEYNYYAEKEPTKYVSPLEYVRPARPSARPGPGQTKVRQRPARTPVPTYVGKTIDGRYKIQEVLGIGGTAIVYRAYDDLANRPVAVKIFEEEYFVSKKLRRRFKNESKDIIMLSHPNIVKVYDVKYSDHLQYIVMEYVEGTTLKEYISQHHAISWNEAVVFLKQILNALQYAHDRGVVHQNIKPQNILLLRGGTVKVMDFGIKPEKVIGSAYYISPEQIKVNLADAKTDIYSAGVVLYEMLTGELPFQSGSMLTVATMQLQTVPRPLRERNAQIPLKLEQIAIRALQKSPADRYQSAAKMLHELNSYKTAG